MSTMEDCKNKIREIIKSSNYIDAIKFGQKICDEANKLDKPFAYLKEYFKNNWSIDECNGLVDYDYENMSLTLQINAHNKACVSSLVQFYNNTPNGKEEESLYPIFYLDVETGEVKVIEPFDESFTFNKAELNNILN